MPCHKKSYKKKAKKASSQSWLTKYKPSTKVWLSPNVGVGRSVSTRLRTSFFYNYTCDAAGVFTGYLNPGSCFDPTGSLATIQPAGFDQWAAFFARYLVTGATVRIEFRGSQAGGATPAAPFVCAAYPSTVTTVPATYQGASSQPYAKTGTFNNFEKHVMLFKLSTQKIVGSRLPPVAEDDGALVGANPTTGQNMILPMFIQYYTGAAATGVLKIDIIQDVTFDQRIQVVDA